MWSLDDLLVVLAVMGFGVRGAGFKVYRVFSKHFHIYGRYFDYDSDQGFVTSISILFSTVVRKFKVQQLLSVGKFVAMKCSFK